MEPVLDELIHIFCANGVDYVKLGDVLKYEQPSKYLVKSEEYDDSFEIPVLTAGKTFILGYTDEIDGIYPANPRTPVIIFDDFTTAFRWVDFPFKAKSSAMKMLTPLSNENSFRFIYYAMYDVGVDTTDHKRRWISQFSNQLIPLPPREVQDKIVEYLDAFSAVCDNLDTEIAQREEQFKHYRHQLLSFEENDEFEYVRLGKVATRQRGTSITATRMKELDSPAGNVTVFAAGSTKAQVPEDSVPQSAIHMAPSIVVKARGYVNFEYFDRPFTTKSELWSYRATDDSASIKFVGYTLQENKSHFQEIARMNGVKLPQLKVSDTDNYSFPLPPRKDQDEIVEKLDVLRELIDNLRHERELRQKQFEYYREQSLNFKPKEQADD